MTLTSRVIFAVKLYTMGEKADSISDIKSQRSVPYRMQITHRNAPIPYTYATHRSSYTYVVETAKMKSFALQITPRENTNKTSTRCRRGSTRALRSRIRKITRKIFT